LRRVGKVWGVILFPFFIEKKDVIIAEISYNNTNKGKTAM
jgi:hypothetical protein